jgi:hypothetical protein
MGFGVLMLGLLVGCGGGAPKADAPQVAAPRGEKSPGPQAEEGSAEDATPDVPADSAEIVVPSRCMDGQEPCVPPAHWVRKLCDGVYAEVALVMFREGTPWQRLYLRGKTEAVNASGGASVAGFLEFDEEVLMLRHRGADKDGIQIGDGSGQYDALRWNGSCVSLEGGEVTSALPPKPKSAPVEWRWLGARMRSALREDPTVDETYRARRKECKGVTMGNVSKKCEQLDTKLTQVITDYVRSGAQLPDPEDHP